MKELSIFSLIIPCLVFGSAVTTAAAQVGAGPMLTTVRVVDAESRTPIPGTTVTVGDTLVVIADADGGARISFNASTTIGVVVTRIGYLSWEGSVAAGQETIIGLRPSPIVLDEVRVRSRALGLGEAFQAASVIGQLQLAERMAPSLAAIVATIPGVTARTNGPVASQPVIRGLSGDRVVVLEDGLRTGDIATTAPDHAVTIEPATARTIEVIRGPAGLLYGSNTLGGVINVVREDVPRERVDEIDWSMTTFGETVNLGVGGAGRALVGLGPIALQADFSARSAEDTRTPGGVPLPFTDLHGLDLGVGVSAVGEPGFIGAAAREYRTAYGVPSSYAGTTLPGAHDGGVYVEAQRTSGRVDGEWRLPKGLVNEVVIGANAVRFEQSEFEKGGFVGTRFGQLATSGEAVVRLGNDRHNAAIGVSAQWRDLRAEGSYTGTRPATQTTYAVYAVDELRMGSFDLLFGLRADRIVTAPLDSTETLLLRDIRTRAFTALTGAVGARVDLATAWSLSIQASRAFRPPSIEELFSAGPHLASYAYEVGRPTLGAERGLGLDAVLRWQTSSGRVELTGYAMRVADHVTFEPQIDPETGQPMRDPRLRRYTVYRPEQVDASFIGLELSASIVPAPGWLIDVAADLPRAWMSDGAPLANIPPGGSRLEVRRVSGVWSAAANVDLRLKQNRVPPPPPTADATCDVVVREGEPVALPSQYCPTDGHALLGFVVGTSLPTRLSRWATRVTLSVDNALDTRWRDPLWRAGLVAPQPGRNVRLAVRVEP